MITPIPNFSPIIAGVLIYYGYIVIYNYTTCQVKDEHYRPGGQNMIIKGMVTINSRIVSGSPIRQ